MQHDGFLKDVVIQLFALHLNDGMSFPALLKYASCYGPMMERF